MRRADRQSRFKNTESILDFFTELNKEGMTIVVVTHDENVARRSSRRVNMKDGQLLGGGEPALSPPSKSRIAASGITTRDLITEAIAGAIARPAPPPPPHGADACLAS